MWFLVAFGGWRCSGPVGQFVRGWGTLAVGGPAVGEGGKVGGATRWVFGCGSVAMGGFWGCWEQGSGEGLCLIAECERGIGNTHMAQNHE
jgi:hypothetical protein